MRFILSAFSKRFDHPILAAVFIFTGLLALSGAAIQILAQSGFIPQSQQIMMTATFLGVYAIFFGGIGVVATLVLLVVRYASVLRDRASPTSG